MSKLKNFTKGIIVENPLFVSLLGTCPALATTKSIESALGMGHGYVHLSCHQGLVDQSLKGSDS